MCILFLQSEGVSCKVRTDLVINGKNWVSVTELGFRF